VVLVKRRGSFWEDLRVGESSKESRGRMPLNFLEDSHMPIDFIML